MRRLLLGVAIALVAFGGASYQAAEAEQGGELPRLVCPLH
jgi:hypothetical protein